MTAFRERTRVSPDTATAAVEADPFADLLARLDYDLYLNDVATGMELAEETYGYLAALDDIDPERDFDHLTLYVTDPLDDLAEAVPDSHFSYVGERLNEDQRTCRLDCGDDASVVLAFGRTHGETLPFTTRYSNVEFALPTVNAYIAYSEARGMA